MRLKKLKRKQRDKINKMRKKVLKKKNYLEKKCGKHVSSTKRVFAAHCFPLQA